MSSVSVAGSPPRQGPELWAISASRARAARERFTAREQMDCETNIRLYGSFCTCGMHEPNERLST